MAHASHAHQVMAVLDGRRSGVGGDPDAGVRASWARSVLEHGLEPDRFVEPEVLTHPELIERRARVEELSVLATPEIDRLFQRLIDHAEVVMLSDAQGAVVHFRSGASVVDRCSNLRVLPGSIWTEERQGTTGLGLCLREQRPLSVVMDEHFATKLGGLSCTVAPIFGEGGKLAGVLNVTAMRHTDHVLQAVVRGMVASSARRIENLYFDRRHDRHRVLRLSRHDDFCDGAAEARVALDESGRVIDATPPAQRLLAAEGASGAGPSLIGARLDAAAGGRDLEKLLARPAPEVLGAQGRVHLRLKEPTRKPISVSSGGSSARQGLHTGRESGRDSGRASGREPRHESGRDSGRGAVEIPALADIVGSDAALAKQVHIAQRVHACGLPLLLQGESGSGKTLLARALHEAGPWRSGNFVAINCAAIPHELIESELFGHRPGAFTGAAKQGSPGRLIAADGGTLLLDEIADMPLALQGRLLQVLSEGEFVPVGSCDAIRIRFALVSATLRDLPTLVRQGSFREDLYFRLCGATVVLPPLRQRADRMALIERAFAHASAEAGRAEVALTSEARQALGRHAWPGNVRELHYVARFSVAVCDTPAITLDALPPPFLEGMADVTDRAVGNAGARCDEDPAAVFAALEQTRWNVSAAARRLGVSRATLHRRLIQFGLERPTPGASDPCLHPSAHAPRVR